MSEINPDPLAAAARGEVNERGGAFDVAPAVGSVSDMLVNEAYAGWQEPASVPLDEVALTLRGSGYDSADLRIVFGGTTDADVARRAELAELADSHPDPLVRWACDLTSDGPPPHEFVEWFEPAPEAPGPSATPSCVDELQATLAASAPAPAGYPPEAVVRKYAEGPGPNGSFVRWAGEARADIAAHGVDWAEGHAQGLTDAAGADCGRVETWQLSPDAYEATHPPAPAEAWEHVLNAGPSPADRALSATPDCVAELAELVERTVGPAPELPAEALAITETPTVAELQAVAVGLVDLDPLSGLEAAAGRPAAPISAPRAEVTPPALGKALRRRQ